MAARRKTSQKNALDLQGQSDPKAPLDSKSLLGAAQPVLKLLAEDLLARAKGSKAVTLALEARHQAEQAQRRTADPFVVWQTHLVDQVAAAWLLSCVFVRTLEDRGLLGAARLAGPGAADSQRLFLDLAPSLGERDYLLTVFRELSLPTVNLDLIINTFGGYIPGHGTPPVLLFGTMEAAQGSDVLLAKRGEPTTPDDAERGLVWRSVADHWSEVGFENDYVSVARLERTTLAKHPWSLGGGGASELKELLEERASQRLEACVESIGIASFTLEDDGGCVP